MTINKTNESFASNQLMYFTVKLTCENSVGTAFLFNITVDELQYPIIITNKHVIEDKEEATVSFSLHLVGDNDEEEQHIVNWTTKWYFHPTHDLCFAFLIL